MSNIISDLSEYVGNTVKKTARFPNTHWAYNAWGKHYKIVYLLQYT